MRGDVCSCRQCPVGTMEGLSGHLRAVPCRHDALREDGVLCANGFPVRWIYPVAPCGNELYGGCPAVRRHGDIQAAGFPRGQVEGMESAGVLLCRPIQVSEGLRLVAGTGLHPAGRPQQERLQLCRNPPPDATGRPGRAACFPQPLVHACRGRFARSQDA